MMINDLFESPEVLEDPSSDRDCWVSAPTLAFEHWVNYIAHPQGKNTGYSDVSIKQFRSMFGAFTKFLEERGLNMLSIGPAQVSDFLANLPGRDPGVPGKGSHASRRARASTLQRYVTLLDDLMNHLVRQGFRRENPMYVGAREVTRGYGEGRLVCLPQIVDERLQQYLLHEMATEAWDQRRSRALLLFLLGSGVMSSNAGGALITEFVFDDETPSYDVPPSQGREGYRAPLSPFCVAPLQEWIRERQAQTSDDETASALAFPKEDGSELSSVSIYKIVRAALRAIDFQGDDMGPRVLRTTYARRQLLAGSTIPQVMGAIGVTNDKSLVRLLKISPTRSGFVPS
ncbi:MAG: tyrosine-type recombinase/integrase [Burkholderiales bacterium]|nr:tyrosine-type recombinase/integrase [Burkholderiales bacterium]